MADGTSYSALHLLLKQQTRSLVSLKTDLDMHFAAS